MLRAARSFTKRREREKNWLVMTSPAFRMYNLASSRSSVKPTCCRGSYVQQKSSFQGPGQTRHIWLCSVLSRPTPHIASSGTRNRFVAVTCGRNVTQTVRENPRALFVCFWKVSSVPRCLCFAKGNRPSFSSYSSHCSFIRLAKVWPLSST